MLEIGSWRLGFLPPTSSFQLLAVNTNFRIRHLGAADECEMS